MHIECTETTTVTGLASRGLTRVATVTVSKRICSDRTSCSDLYPHFPVSVNWTADDPSSSVSQTITPLMTGRGQRALDARLPNLDATTVCQCDLVENRAESESIH